MSCQDFTLCKPVGHCGTRIFLGKNTNLTGNEILFVEYSMGGNPVTEATTPIIEGNNVFLDLTDPNKDFYNTHIASYKVWLSDAYMSDYKTLRNSEADHDGLILIFNGDTTQDIAVPCE